MEMERSGNIGKIGIYGGTFNPVHYGHLINIEFIRERYSLDRIIFIPARVPVHKNITDRIAPSERLDMLKLAVSGNTSFEVSEIELERKTPSYTIFTIHEFRELYPDDQLSLIIGSDSFNELDTWKSYKEILSEIPLIIMKRPDSEVLRDDLLGIAAEVNVFDNPLIDISSSMIRERIRKGFTARYLTPDAVIDYINRKGLYRN